jgi:hypothetical protein
MILVKAKPIAGTMMKFATSARVTNRTFLTGCRI